MLTLTPWKKNGTQVTPARVETPIDLLRRFENAFDRVFESYPQTPSNYAYATHWGGSLKETDKAVFVKLDAPGFEADEFDVRIGEDVLTVAAEHKEKSEAGEEVVARSFQRHVALPTAVDAAKVEAAYRNGVLELHLPKSEQAAWQKVAVKGA